ncbi:MAG: hypothetical protein K0U64_12360 [Actinomycetia bacterium]|nr:hypothetical protein [Actinomycetes bacterium]
MVGDVVGVALDGAAVVGFSAEGEESADSLLEHPAAISATDAVPRAIWILRFVFNVTP